MEFHGCQFWCGCADFSWIIYHITSYSECCSMGLCFLWSDIAYRSHITEIWVHQVHILCSDRVHIYTHFSIMLFMATIYFMIKHALKMKYLKYMHILKMGTYLYPVFCVVWVLNVLEQVEKVLAQVENYFWRIIPQFHHTSHTHKINLPIYENQNEWRTSPNHWLQRQYSINWG